jgi:hypothetical protein
MKNSALYSCGAHVSVLRLSWRIGHLYLRYWRRQGDEFLRVSDGINLVDKCLETEYCINNSITLAIIEGG